MESVARSSVLRDHRAAPAIVHADGDEVDVLPDAIGAEKRAGHTGDAVVGEGEGAIAHEQVIVFDRGRPVRREAVLEARADRATPAGVADGVGGENVGADNEAAEAVVRHRGAALHVEQHVVDGIADLAGEKAEGADTRLIVEARSEQADVPALEVRPVTLAFNTEHPGAGLPAITDLTTGDTAGRVVATFVGDEHAGRSGEVPALAAPIPSAVGADA